MLNTDHTVQIELSDSKVRELIWAELFKQGYKKPPKYSAEPQFVYKKENLHGMKVLCTVEDPLHPAKTEVVLYKKEAIADYIKKHGINTETHKVVLNS